jgi:hypothetical protein
MAAYLLCAENQYMIYRSLLHLKTLIHDDDWFMSRFTNDRIVLYIYIYIDICIYIYIYTSVYICVCIYI